MVGQNEEQPGVAEIIAKLDGAIDLEEVDLLQVIDTMPQIVWITRPDGWHEFYNRQWFAFTGLTWQESLGHRWNPAFHPEDRARAAARWAQATTTGEPYEIEYRLRRSDGIYRWMLGRAQPLRDASGTVVKWLGTCTDIEDLKRAQAELDESRTLRRLAGSMARLGGWSIDLATHRVVWSEEIFEILAYPPEADPDLDESLEHYLPEHRAALDAALESCAAHGTPFDLELEMVNYAGMRLWVHVIGEAQYGPDGSVSHVTGALQDISQVKASAQQTEVLAERLTTTLESITDGFFTVGRDWTFTYVNQQAERLLGRDREELLGRLIWDEYPALLGTTAETEYRRAMRQQSTVVLDEHFYPPLGRWFQVHVYPSENGIAVYFRDVSEQRAARRALHERVKELEALAAVSRVAHEVDDAQALCRSTAAHLTAAMQYPDRVGVTVELGATYGRAGMFEEGSAHFATPVVADGETVGRIAVTHPHGELLDEERSLVTSVAETLALWHLHREASRELEQANAQLQDTARFKDDLLSMASHELRTPLTPILGFLEMLQTRGHNLTDDQHHVVEVIASNARRMLRLVDDLLVVSLATAGSLVASPQPVDIGAVLAPMLREAGDLIGPVALELSASRAHVDPRHLQQMVLNLLTNADKYGTPPLIVRSLRDGDDHIRLEVIDHGPGVPASFRKAMWERFTQSDRGDTRTASGVGLGLSIVKLLAEANGGHVTYRDNAPTGAVFTIHLPAPDAGGGTTTDTSGTPGTTPT